MEQLITTALVLSILGALLIFLIKHQFKEMTEGIKGTNLEIQSIRATIQSSNDELEDKLKEQIQRNHDKLNERVGRLEEKNEKEIAGIKKELGDVKGDFATSFVLREDYFRTMTSVENNIKETDRKIDKILFLITDKKN